jgi:hypothetical protein
MAALFDDAVRGGIENAWTVVKAAGKAASKSAGTDVTFIFKSTILW